MQVAPMFLLSTESSATCVFLRRTRVEALLRCIASSNNLAVDVSSALFLEDYENELIRIEFKLDYGLNQLPILTYIIELSLIDIVLELFNQLF